LAVAAESQRPGHPPQKDTLKPVSWDEEGNIVVIPMWTKAVAEYSALLEKMTIGTLFESLGRIPEIAPNVRDPEGMLLTPEQRIERARSLVGSAVGLAMVHNGWKLHAGPAVFYLEKEGEQVDPFQVVRQLSEGTLSSTDWKTRCQTLGISDIPVASTKTEAGAASQQA